LDRGTGRTFAAPTLTRTFSVKVVVTDIPPPPKHEHGKVAFGPITASITQGHDVKFAVGKSNLAGETKLATQEERDLRAWYMQLSPETRKAMHEGTIVPRLNGYTSTTDSAPHNRVLARQRVQAVEEVLKDWGVTKFDETAPGEYPYLEEDPKQEVEDPADRRVAIEVDEAPVQVAPAEPDFVEGSSP
jgi:outer membrane protein OmpA-like peptidoglycan-associated protein